MTEDRNGPESSRLLDVTTISAQSDLKQKEHHEKLLVQTSNNGDVCGGRGDQAIIIEMVSSLQPHSPGQEQKHGPPEEEEGHHAIISNNEGIDEDSDDDYIVADSACTRRVEAIHKKIHSFLASKKPVLYKLLKVAALLGYLVYFIYSMIHQFGDKDSVTLLIITLFGLFLLLRKTLLKNCQLTQLKNCLTVQRNQKNRRAWLTVKWLLRVGAVAFLVVFLVISVWRENPENLRSLLGILGFVAVLFIFSNNPAKVNWHTVFWGIVLQMLLGVIILRTHWGLSIFDWIGKCAKAFLDFGLAGAKFLFGKEGYLAHKVLFITAAIMIYFNSVISILFHLGVVQAVINNFGRFLAFCLGTGPIESFAASANIFISLTETPMMLRPYLPHMTKSELHTVLTCGFASISGAVLGTYVHYGIPANHLLTASVMSAPAALAVSKLLHPETERSRLRRVDYNQISTSRSRNILQAAAEGAGNAIGLASHALASQLAFVSLLDLLNALLGWFGNRAGFQDVTFKMICSYLFYPLVYAMGTEVSDCSTVASLLGVKLFATPIIAYTALADLSSNRVQLESYIRSTNSSGGFGNTTWSWQGEDVVLYLTNTTLVGGVISERSEVIALYMLCGFSTITSIGVCLGVLLCLAEDRKKDIIDMVVNTLVGGNFASFLTAAVAGLLIKGKPLPT